MNIRRKKDSEKIKDFIRTLKNEPWLGQARKWWPDYVFRVDNIDATAKILNTGKLLSRAAAQAAGVMGINCASSRVIASTDAKWQQYVRLYFRPRTPTQYDNEGFRPINQYMLHAHCPIPIVMLFDAGDILTRENTEFSNGNLAGNTTTGDDALFLKQIPFDKVYHDTWCTSKEKRTIVFHRHAEVIVPYELDLSALRFIGCRTQAEYETLMHILEPKTREKWSNKIGLGTKFNLHYKHWLFVERVELNTKAIQFTFNPSCTIRGPFEARVEINIDAINKKYDWAKNPYEAESSLLLNISSIKSIDKYTVKLFLDGKIAYSNHYVECNLPF